MESYKLFTLIMRSGWILVILGLIVSIAGVVNMLDMFYNRYISTSTFLMAVLPGVFTIFFGMMSVACTQVGRSIADLTETSNEMLKVAARL